ncbi:homoserine O-acetyltransferase [Candidatus Koribacter versatilis Ellin345]|uniref:Homoserine O-acetyltransferase n=1 Tax=Koribacter versatilis (strain Ellin345) TaxID=204669 RepID=Q1II02_KORVE|nr:homoserine O-acetyltransferase [Candidatus Koribacter versatilis]ABF43498.1 homoserine O-acetyltransferase [Candidatus Koribacter versatilis Ellin345]
MSTGTCTVSAGEPIPAPRSQRNLHLIQGAFTFADEGFPLDNGGSLRPVTIRYAQYGEPNAKADNVVLVCHALSGSAKVDDWWPELFAEGGLLDLDKFCVIGTNILGSCYGSTGPNSINAETGQPYGADFPLVTISDIVRAQAKLLDHLGIKKLKLAIGGSIGGMQALHWAMDYPDRVEQAIAIGTAPLGALGLALNHIQRQVIRLDPKWNAGSYSHENSPSQGISIARQIAMLSYKSAELFDERYGRKLNRNGEDPYTHHEARFDVGGYLDHQGEKFVQRFDANSYVSITRTMDTFDPVRKYRSAKAAYSRIKAKITLVGISSDWLFPPEDVRKLAQEMIAAGASCDYREIISAHGHDAFLAEPEKLLEVLSDAHARPV